MKKTEIIKGLKIATNKIGGCSDVGGWLSDDESEARYACEQVIKGFEDGTIILREEDKCTSVEELEKLEEEIIRNSRPYREKLVIDVYTCQMIIRKEIAELKGENKDCIDCNNNCDNGCCKKGCIGYCEGKYWTPKAELKGENNA